MSSPVVGLVVGHAPPDDFARLVADLARWCRPLVIDAGTAPDAWLTVAPAVPPRDGRPFAAWIDTPAALSDGPAIFVTADPDVAAVDSDRVVLAGGRVDGVAVRCLSPFVRARYRRARALPDELVLDVDALPADVRDTALSLASAVVVTGDAVVDALARGAPVVTDAISAASAGATDGLEVIVGGMAEARALGGDLRWAAALSSAGRSLFDMAHDRSRAPRRVAAALGLLAPAERVMTEFATPWTSFVRDRINGLVA